MHGALRARRAQISAQGGGPENEVPLSVAPPFTLISYETVVPVTVVAVTLHRCYSSSEGQGFKVGCVQSISTTW